MYILGHMVWAYLIGRAAGKVVKADVPLFALLFLGVLPDFDLYFMWLGFPHHTYTHSFVVWLPVFLAVFLLFKRKSVPYIAVVAQHFLVADLLVGSVPLFLPVSELGVGLSLGFSTMSEVVLELGAMVVAAVYAYSRGDVQSSLKPVRSNVLLVVPLFALVSLTLLFANELGVTLLEYGFAGKSISLISSAHLMLAGFLALSTFQGLRIKEIVLCLKGL